MTQKTIDTNPSFGETVKKGMIYELLEDMGVIQMKKEQHDWYGENIKQVIYADPATIVLWQDGTKTVVKVQDGDTYDPLIGFLLAVCKRCFGNGGAYNNVLRKAVPGYGMKVSGDEFDDNA